MLKPHTIINNNFYIILSYLLTRKRIKLFANYIFKVLESLLFYINFSTNLNIIVVCYLCQQFLLSFHYFFDSDKENNIKPKLFTEIPIVWNKIREIELLT